MDRRRFLHLGQGSFFTSTGLTALLPPRADDRERVFTLRAVAARRTLSNGRAVNIWAFRQTLPGPGALEAGWVISEEERILVILSNELHRAIRWIIPGVLEDTPIVAPGATVRFRFTAPPAGSYFFTDGEQEASSRAMGLAAPMVVMPADGSPCLRPGGISFHRQYTFLLQEIDSRISDALDADQSFHHARYAPDNRFINGLSHIATRNDKDTHIRTTLGERLALRFINAGLVHHPVHIHGHARRGPRRPGEPPWAWNHVVRVDPGEVVEVLLDIQRAGIRPLPSHPLPHDFGGTVHPLGGLIHIAAA